MKFDDIQSHLIGIPYIKSENARILYDFVLENKFSEILELGFAHGTASCYIAAALDEIGSGHLTSVDLLSGIVWQKPSIEELLSRAGLQKYVTVNREKTSYNWFLKKQIENYSSLYACKPIYDLCIIDGPKNFTIDGLAFFLVDKLLRENGWIIFDDYNWSYGDSSRSQTDGINHLEMGEDELINPHIKLVFQLLVMQHPDYSEFKVHNNEWAWAHKVSTSVKFIKYTESYSYKAILKKILKLFEH